MGMKRLYWNGDVGWYDSSSGKGITPAMVKQALADAGGDDIEVELTTFGGNFFDGVAIMDLLRGYKGKKTGFGSSIVASAGTVISLGFDRFLVKPTTMFMIHNAQGWSSGDHNQMREDADLYERMSNLIAEEYVKKTGKKLADVKKLMDDETWLMGKEIVDNGFADAMEDDEAHGTSMMLVMAQKQFRDRVTMWAKAKPEPVTMDAATKDAVEKLIEAGAVDKVTAWTVGASDKVVGFKADTSKDGFRYPVAKNGKVFRSSLRSIAARAATEEPELAEWATAMIAKIDAKGAKKLTEDEAIEFLKDKPEVFARVALAAGHGARLVNQSHAALIEMKAKMDAAKIVDPVAEVTQLRADLEAVESKRIENALNDAYGPVKLKHNGQVNELREMAGIRMAGVKFVDLEAKMVEFNALPSVKRLAGELMDANSEVNLLGFVEMKAEEARPTSRAGVPVLQV